MPRQQAEPHHADQVEDLLHKSGAAHLRVRKYGASILVESGSEHAMVKHFRLRRDTIHLWCLDMATHRGAWERTPFRASIDELVQTVLDDFSWMLTPIGD